MSLHFSHSPKSVLSASESSVAVVWTTVYEYLPLPSLFIAYALGGFILSEMTIFSYLKMIVYLNCCQKTAVLNQRFWVSVSLQQKKYV